MQSAINMHLSQISHGRLSVFNSDYVGEKAMFLPDEVNEIITGYTPSMIKLFIMDDGAEMEFFGLWYDWAPDTIWRETGAPVDSFVTVTERGFLIDGEELASINSDAAMIIWETYGCKNNDDYYGGKNPAPVNGDNAMDPIPGWQPNVDHVAYR